MGSAQNMTSHVTQRPRAEIKEAAPVERNIEALGNLVAVSTAEVGGVRRAARGIRPRGGDSQPEVPIDIWGDRLRRRDFGQALRPDGTARPGMDLSDVANFAGPDDL